MTATARQITTAQRIAAVLDGDGTLWTSPQGETLDDLCKAAGAVAERQQDRVRYVFVDGSVITAVGGGWDLGYLDCWCWQSCAHDLGCEAARKAVWS